MNIEEKEQYLRKISTLFDLHDRNTDFWYIQITIHGWRYQKYSLTREGAIEHMWDRLQEEKMLYESDDEERSVDDPSSDSDDSN